MFEPEFRLRKTLGRSESESCCTHSGVVSLSCGTCFVFTRTFRLLRGSLGRGYVWEHQVTAIPVHAGGGLCGTTARATWCCFVCIDRPTVLREQRLCK